MLERVSGGKADFFLLSLHDQVGDMVEILKILRMNCIFILSYGSEAFFKQSSILKMESNQIYLF
jgi:hypothetical protein